MACLGAGGVFIMAPSSRQPPRQKTMGNPRRPPSMLQTFTVNELEGGWGGGKGLLRPAYVI